MSFPWLQSQSGIRVTLRWTPQTRHRASTSSPLLLAHPPYIRGAPQTSEWLTSVHINNDIINIRCITRYRIVHFRTSARTLLWVGSSRWLVFTTTKSVRCTPPQPIRRFRVNHACFVEFHETQKGWAFQYVARSGCGVSTGSFQTPLGHAYAWQNEGYHRAIDSQEDAECIETPRLSGVPQSAFWRRESAHGLGAVGYGEVAAFSGETMARALTWQHTLPSQEACSYHCD